MLMFLATLACTVMLRAMVGCIGWKLVPMRVVKGVVPMNSLIMRPNTISGDTLIFNINTEKLANTLFSRLNNIG